jgi:hypothetical protein
MELSLLAFSQVEQYSSHSLISHVLQAGTFRLCAFEAMSMT